MPNAKDEQGKRDTRRKDLADKVDKRRRRKFKGEDGKWHWSAGKGPRADSAASKALQPLVEKYGPTGPGDGGDTLVRDYVEKWLAVKRADVRYSTWLNYTYMADGYILPMIGDKKIAAVRPSDIQSCLAKTAGKSAGTRNKAVFLLRSIFAAADIDGILTRNPAKAAKRKKDDPEKRFAFTADEEKAITRHFRDPDCAIMPLLYYTGMRRGEAFALQWKHVDFGAKKIMVDQQVHWTDAGYVVDRALKTENSRRAIPMPDELAAILRPLRGHRSAFIIQGAGGARLDQNHIRYMLCRLRDTTGLSALVYHQFRHNYATKLYAAGVKPKQAAKVLGETVTIMMKTYVHIEKQLGGEDQDAIRSAFSSEVASGLPGK